MRLVFSVSSMRFSFGKKRKDVRLFDVKHSAGEVIFQLSGPVLNRRMSACVCAFVCVTLCVFGLSTSGQVHIY